jgi:hypothetical protein
MRFRLRNRRVRELPFMIIIGPTGLQLRLPSASGLLGFMAQGFMPFSGDSCQSALQHYVAV